MIMMHKGRTKGGGCLCESDTSRKYVLICKDMATMVSLVCLSGELNNYRFVLYYISLVNNYDTNFRQCSGKWV